MGKNLKPQFSFRTDKELIKKIEFIAEQETRNRNQQIEYLIKKCIKEYEEKNGKLIYTKNEEVILESTMKRENLSKSKIG